MPSRHHRRSYRITAIFLAFLLLGAAILIPFAVQDKPQTVTLIVLGSVWLIALVGTIVGNEIYIKKKYGGNYPKKDEEE